MTVALVLVSVLGAAWHATVITDATFDFFHLRNRFAGIYNYYFLSLIEGRFDVPGLIAFYEGQYTEDGRAYLYYGVLPALLRAPLHPFIDLSARPAGPLIVWLAMTGTGVLLTSLWAEAVRRARPEGGATGLAAALAGTIGIWFASGVPLIAADASVYHEPIALAFLLSAAFLRLSLPLAWGAPVRARRIVGLAVLAGLAVHARPHVAVGLYAGLLVLLLVLLRQDWRRWRAPAAGALVILGLLGGALLAINALRFGNPLSMTSAGLQHMSSGNTYFGFGLGEGRRADAPSAGKFSVILTVPNTATYLSGTPSRRLEVLLDTPSVRNEAGVRSMVLLWPFWLGLGVLGAGLAALRLNRLAGIAQPAMLLASTLAVLIPAYLLLAYRTTTLRYEAELWMPLFLFTALGIAPLAAATQRPGRAAMAGLVCALLLAMSVAVTGATQIWYSKYFETISYPFQRGTIWGITEERCFEWFANFGDQARGTEAVCSAPVD